MVSRVGIALDYRKKGYTCSQAILCTYADLLDIDFKAAFRLSEGFGLGMGLKSVCGVLSGVFMVASLISSDGNIDTPKTKAQTYKLNTELANDFMNEHKTIMCADLKGLTDKSLFKNCNELVEYGCKIVETKLLTKYFSN